jgi:tRNA modification GTPase
MLDRTDETIVAVSSAPGCGAVGILRLSGSGAIGIVDMVARTDDGAPLSALPGWRRVSGAVRVIEELEAPAAFYLFRAPRSYTRQDLVEIQTIGSPPLLDMLRRRLIELGARHAEPGEFTARAFLSGAMDLSSAEAVAGIIRAQSDTQLRAARRLMDGELSRRVAEARDELAELMALVEAEIDFAEEPIDFITPAQLKERLHRVGGKLEDWLAGGQSLERFGNVAQILLFGAPNAGKSSLMNRLSGTDRAICAAAAGTTRDILSAPVSLGGREAILLDTAGVDSSEDEIIAAARAMAVSAADRVDLVCVVADLTQPEDRHVVDWIRRLAPPKVVMAANKCDRLAAAELMAGVARLEKLGLGPVCAVSALRGDGIGSLRTILAESLGEQTATTLGEALLLSERQRSAVTEAAAGIRRAGELAERADDTIDCADLLAFELREALDALGSVTGEVTTEDLLSRVFASFCIGK